jgi:hypothetical protein
MFRRSRFHESKLTGAMRQFGEGGHAETLKFSDEAMNRRRPAPSACEERCNAGLLPQFIAEGSSEMKGPSRPGTRTLTIYG